MPPGPPAAERRGRITRNPEEQHARGEEEEEGEELVQRTGGLLLEAAAGEFLEVFVALIACGGGDADEDVGRLGIGGCGLLLGDDGVVGHQHLGEVAVAPAVGEVLPGDFLGAGRQGLKEQEDQDPDREEDQEGKDGAIGAQTATATTGAWAAIRGRIGAIGFAVGLVRHREWSGEI